jgi:oxalate decarboxylase/phosphoglucose isomerase-like protein (cupin superfamily)
MAMKKLGAGAIVNAADVETLAYDWGMIKLLSEPKVTGANRMTFGMVVLDPGKGHGRHDHPGVEEIIYVMSGEGLQMVDDRPPLDIGPGTCIYLPPGTPHSTLNTGWEPLRLIIVYSPTGPEEVLRGIPDCRILAPGQLRQS